MTDDLVKRLHNLCAPDGVLALHSNSRDDVYEAVRVILGVGKKLRLITNTLEATLRDPLTDEWLEFCKAVIEHSRSGEDQDD